MKGALLTLVLAGMLAGGLFVGPAPASAVSELERVRSASPINSVSPKTVHAYCPPGKRVIGGGGWVNEYGYSLKLALTRLQPMHPAEGFQDSYAVTGAEVTGIDADWWLEAWALCADPLPGLHIVSALGERSSSSPQATAVECPAGERVLGTGGMVAPGAVLQAARASGPGDIARVVGREPADGFAGNWSVSAYAVCAKAPPGYEVVMEPSPEQGSETVKRAEATCPAGKQVHSVGAAIANTAPEGVSLQAVAPNSDLRRGVAYAFENSPISQSWDFIVAQVICAF